MKRQLATFRVAAGQPWLDLRALETRIAPRSTLATELTAWSLADFDLSDALGRDRVVTQAIAHWAYEAGYHGLAYTSRFGCGYDCWAIFDRARISVERIESISSDDLDLLEVARLFDLGLPSAGR